MYVEKMQEKQQITIHYANELIKGLIFIHFNNKFFNDNSSYCYNYLYVLYTFKCNYK